MRDIIFRGKRTDNGKWVEGFYAHFKDLYKEKETHRIYTHFAESDCGEFYPDYYEVDPDTVGQYTGTDKNGKKVFEGDIVCLRTGRAYEVKYEDGSFCIEGTTIPVKYLNKFTVIGNIHDGLMGD